jgi:hypothetical protein
MLERGTMPSPRRTCAEATLAATSTAIKIILRILSSLRNSWHEPMPAKTLADSTISPSEFPFPNQIFGDAALLPLRNQNNRNNF